MKIIALLAALCVGVACNAANPHKDNLMALPPFERACVLIRHYETLHTPSHWPTIGYGHLVKSGEHYSRRQYSEYESEIIMRNDLAQLCHYYQCYGRDSILLALLAYNVGTVKVDNSELIRKLRCGDRNIYEEYTSFCHYKGQSHKGLFRRRWMELELFFEQ